MKEGNVERVMLEREGEERDGSGGGRKEGEQEWMKEELREEEGGWVRIGKMVKKGGNVLRVGKREKERAEERG